MSLPRALASAPPQPPWRRAAETLVGWALLIAGSPGFLVSTGSTVLTGLGLVVWMDAAARPLGPRPWRARVAELGALALAAGVLFGWVAHVLPAALAYVALGWALWLLPAGPVVRRLGSRLPGALAVGLGLSGLEVLRAATPLPFGMGWLRWGHALGHHPGLGGAARLVGVEGLSFVVALWAGALLSCWRARRAVWGELALAVLALGACAAASALHPAPPTRPGPRILVVQPGIQEERLGIGGAEDDFRRLLELTREGLARSGRVDLVAWGESMLFHTFSEESAFAAWRAGESAPPWWGLDAAAARRQNASLERIVEQVLPEAAGLPREVAFLAGAEQVAYEAGRFRRRVALFLFDGEGHRIGVAAKRHLCSGSETLHGLERFGFVRDLLMRLGGYVPDFTPARRTEVLTLPGAGEPLRFTATVCFDNAFLDPYVAPLRRGRVDFSLVGSNEAWFRTSHEMDQMVAFSRLAALASGRSLVRVTTSGISLALDPNGRELGRIELGGRDRAVAGWRVFEVPIPAAEAGPTPYARSAGFQRWFWALALCAGLGASGRKRR